MATNAKKPRMTAAQKRARKRKKIIIFSVELAVILLMLVVVWYVFRTTSNSEGPHIAELAQTDVLVNSELTENNEVIEGYWNIALFGVDANTKNELYKGSRSDSMMVASINQSTGDIKLISVYRDTYLNQGNDRYNKANHAYSAGGAEQAIIMLNMNLDLNITDFVTVGYQALIDVIDGLGGVWIDVDSEEIKHINNYQYSIAEVLDGQSYHNVTETGYQLLNGLQATAYCRIRYTLGDDFKRAERQREVIQAIEDQAKKADLVTLTKVFTAALPNIYTTIDTDKVMGLLGQIANYNIVDEGGFPKENMRTTGTIGAAGSCVIPLNLESNVVWLHKFLFDVEDYTPTATVQEYSNIIYNNTNAYLR